MLNFLKRETNKTTTENGAATYRSTNSHCLDFFYRVGAMRNVNNSVIEQQFIHAFTENPDLALKILFFARDIREGLGERKVFRTCIQTLAKHAPESLNKNLIYIAEFGRYDDLLTLMNTPCEGEVLSLITAQLKKDIIDMEHQKSSISLLAKWLPSVNASSKETIALAKKIARALHMSDSGYRKTLAKLRRYIDIIENHLREKDYNFSYEKQPSKAMYRYKKHSYEMIRTVT